MYMETSVKRNVRRSKKVFEKGEEDYYTHNSPIHQSIAVSASPREKLPESKLTRPKNVRQEKYIELLKNHACRILLATGPAGTGKTVFACEYGLWGLLKGHYNKLIFTRPLVSVDEEFGFLPGTMEEKMAPWIRPIYDVLVQYISQKELDMMMEEKIIEIIPLGFMRGRTFKHSWIVADEMQNSTHSQTKMLLTRIGQGSKMVITGDLQQCDYSYYNGLSDFLHLLHKTTNTTTTEEEKEVQKKIVHFEFQNGDIQRDPVVAEILDIYKGI